MRYKQQFKVNASLQDVWQLHDDPKALPELTPPPIQVKIVSIDQPLKAGANLRFRMGLGPFGVIWHAVYDEFNPYQPGLKRCGFVDRSASGPFHSWTHRHTFDDLGDDTTNITDDARFELIGGLLGVVINPLIAWPAVAFMFLYRRQKTRQMIAQGWRA